MENKKEKMRRAGTLDAEFEKSLTDVNLAVVQAEFNIEQHEQERATKLLSSTDGTYKSEAEETKEETKEGGRKTRLKTRLKTRRKTKHKRKRKPKHKRRRKTKRKTKHKRRRKNAKTRKK